jgi:hypothetical protein
MRIIYNKTAGVLSEEARSRLQRIFFQDTEATSRTLRDIFPHQLVSTKFGRTLVIKKDGSIVIDILQDGNSETNWIESAVNLRMTIK